MNQNTRGLCPDEGSTQDMFTEHHRSRHSMTVFAKKVIYHIDFGLNNRMIKFRGWLPGVVESQVCTDRQRVLSI